MSKKNLEAKSETTVAEEEPREEIDREHQAKKGFAMLVKAINAGIFVFGEGTGHMTLDTSRKLALHMQQALAVAKEIAGYEDFTDCNVDVSRCRACGKIQWMDLDQNQYCGKCIRSTRQANPHGEEPSTV